MNGRVFVLMGVSGSGKSTVGAMLAAKTGGNLVDGDFLHPKANLLKMASGMALDDHDRGPWLERLADAVFAMGRVGGISFLVCSALKRAYRHRLREGNAGLMFVYLKGSREVIADRMVLRKGHFFKAGMLDSQFDSLEEPDAEERDVITVSIDQPIEELVEEILLKIGIS